MAYAKTTIVPVVRTKAEIEAIAKKYGAVNFGIMNMAENIVIVFSMNSRNIMFKMMEPEDAQEARSIWRAMMMTIKMKLESCERGIESFEEAFLAQIVAPDGVTYGDHMIPKISDNYSNNSIPLLPKF